MKKKRLKKYLQRLLKANLHLQQSLNLKKNDIDFWKMKAVEFAPAYNKTLAERDEWKDAANKNLKLYENLINTRYEKRKANKKLIEDAVNVLDLCFGVMMQPYILQLLEDGTNNKLGIDVHPKQWKEARDQAEKLYYDLKSILKKNDLNETGNHFQDSFRYAMTAFKPEFEKELTGCPIPASLSGQRGEL